MLFLCPGCRKPNSDSKYLEQSKGFYFLQGVGDKSQVHSSLAFKAFVFKGKEQ